jgi:beta-glucosidase
MSSATMPRNGTVNASVTVTNTGDRDGATVVQMYLHDEMASISRPVKELKGFKRIMLKAGESQTVTFPIDVNALKFWNAKMQQVAEPGKFNVMIGLDSARTTDAEFTYL